MNECLNFGRAIHKAEAESDGGNVSPSNVKTGQDVAHVVEIDEPCILVWNRGYGCAGQGYGHTDPAFSQPTPEATS